MRVGHLIAVVVLAVLTIISLVFNAGLIIALHQYQKIALAMISDARLLLAETKAEKITYNFHFSQEIPFNSSVPFQAEFTVPVSTSVPINTVVSVPVGIGPFTYNVRVPINTVFPFQMDFTVPVSTTFPVSMSVPIEMDIPVAIPLAETPLAGHLDQADQLLSRFAAQLADPMAVIRAGVFGSS